MESLKHPPPCFTGRKQKPGEHSPRITHRAQRQGRSRLRISGKASSLCAVSYTTLPHPETW